MPIIYGADSKFPANTKLTNGFYLYDWVVRKSCYPSFWGRAITGEGTITREEIDFLKSRNCKIACMVTHINEVEISGNEGINDAWIAIKAAKALGIPENSGIALFAYIPSDWSVNHNWMIGYAKTLFENGYIPGFAGNTDSSMNFNFNRQCSHYVQGTRQYNEFSAVYWATEPKYDFDPDVWAPYAPSEQLPKDMDMWQYGTVEFHGISANKDYVRDSSIMKHFWI